MAKDNSNADQLITTILAGIEDVKGKDIKILDLREIENTVCDYFIICEVTSKIREDNYAVSRQSPGLYRPRPDWPGFYQSHSELP